MSDVAALSLALLRRVAEFLEALPEDHVSDLAEGRARLAYVPWGATTPVAPKARRRSTAAKVPTVDVEAIIAQLKVANTRDEGRQLLTPLSATDMQAVAKATGMTGTSKTRKNDLLEQIVSLTIGGRASYAAIRET